MFSELLCFPNFEDQKNIHVFFSYKKLSKGVSSSLNFRVLNPSSVQVGGWGWYIRLSDVHILLW